MGKIRYLTEKREDGKVFYSVVYLMGCAWALLNINIAQEGWFSFKMLMGGILTAAGARIYNRVIVPKWEQWRIKRRQRNHKDSLPQ